MNLISIADEIKVSPIGLGTVNFGTGVSEEDCFEQLDRYLDAGNLIDTAHVYGDWVPGERGRSERVIGKWLASRRCRERVVISTKGAHPRLTHMDSPRVKPEEIRLDLEESLRCLQTDVIDLYFLHRDDPTRPVGELLECLEDLRKAGRIRSYGCSNWRLPRMIEAARYAQAHGLRGFVCNQLMWSLAAVNPAQVSDPTLVGMDAETYAYHRQSRMAAMAYMSIANGYFAHLARGDLKASVRLKYDQPINSVIYGRLRELSKAHDLSITQLSLLYFAAMPFPSVALASFSSIAQLEECAQLLQIPDRPEIYPELEGLRSDLLQG
ncbi:MAG: aldo/keto reductase [Clostridia bacterium]|nr:aldo/keto reductase [Clostridia bacterium]